MKNIKMALVDNDYVVLTKADLDEAVKGDKLSRFFSVKIYAGVAIP